MNNKDIREYITKKEEIQIKILEFLDSEQDDENNFKDLVSLLDDSKIRDNKHDLKSLLYLLIKIADNHHRTSNFFSKIEQILQLYETEIKENFSNFEIFNIFKTNKRIILFLIEKEIIKPDHSISHIITSTKYKHRKYPEFFYPEFKTFFSEDLCKEINYINQENQKNSDLFEEKRKIGENSNIISQIIRNDNVEDFIVYVTRTNISLFSQIEPSIFETNLFLMKHKPTLIEYAAFFGSIQILKHLQLKNIKLNSSLWHFAIHSGNNELFHYLEENHIELEEDDIYIESIKCHQIDFMDYIKENLLAIKGGKFFNYFSQRLKYFNFHDFVEIIDYDFKSRAAFFDLCQFDYFNIVEKLIEFHENDINAKYILKLFLFNYVFF